MNKHEELHFKRNKLTWAPFSTWSRAMAIAFSIWLFLMRFLKRREPVTLQRSPTLTKLILESSSSTSRPVLQFFLSVVSLTVLEFNEIKSNTQYKSYINVPARRVSGATWGGLRGGIDLMILAMAAMWAEKTFNRIETTTAIEIFQMIYLALYRSNLRQRWPHRRAQEFAPIAPFHRASTRCEPISKTQTTWAKFLTWSYPPNAFGKPAFA